MTISESTVAIITGASSGIGRALALHLAERGARLGLIARRAEKLNEVAWEAMKNGAADVLALPCDITDREAFQRAIGEIHVAFGRIDILVNNAGFGHIGYVEDTPQEHVESVFQVNVFALWYGAAAVLPLMKEQGSGQIITISSMAGVMPFPANAAYVAAKHAAVGFTRALRSELAGTGVEAMVVLPAGTMTEWALVTEGGSILPLFEYENERSVEIAEELNIEKAVMPPLLPSDDVAKQIVTLIEHPAPVLYTHPNSEELAQRFAEDQVGTEYKLLPSWLANREGYLKMRDELRVERGELGEES